MEEVSYEVTGSTPYLPVQLRVELEVLSLSSYNINYRTNDYNYTFMYQGSSTVLVLIAARSSCIHV